MRFEKSVKYTYKKGKIRWLTWGSVGLISGLHLCTGIFDVGDDDLQDLIKILMFVIFWGTLVFLPFAFLFYAWNFRIMFCPKCEGAMKVTKEVLEYDSYYKYDKQSGEIHKYYHSRYRDTLRCENCGYETVAYNADKW